MNRIIDFTKRLHEKQLIKVSQSREELLNEVMKFIAEKDSESDPEEEIFELLLLIRNELDRMKSLSNISDYTIDANDGSVTIRIAPAVSIDYVELNSVISSGSHE